MPKQPPLKVKQIPATQESIDLLETRLRSEMTAMKLELKADIQGIDTKTSSLKADIQKVDAKTSSLKADIQGVDAKTSSLKAEIQKVYDLVHKTHALVERQERRNRYVLDGYDQIYRRQEEHEQRMKQLEAKT